MLPQLARSSSKEPPTGVLDNHNILDIVFGDRRCSAVRSAGGLEKVPQLSTKSPPDSQRARPRYTCGQGSRAATAAWTGRVR